MYDLSTHMYVCMHMSPHKRHVFSLGHIQSANGVCALKSAPERGEGSADVARGHYWSFFLVCRSVCRRLPNERACVVAGIRRGKGSHQPSSCSESPKPVSEGDSNRSMLRGSWRTARQTDRYPFALQVTAVSDGGNDV